MRYMSRKPCRTPQVIFDDLVVGEWRSGGGGRRGPGEVAAGEDVDVHGDGPGLVVAERAEASY